jgi:DNA polymerase
MLVGEQPGDREDLEGRPFVGPAGQVLDRALAEAGLERSNLYLTNAVKHFKFAPRGKRRIHQRPDVGEIQACGHWLALERRLVRPRLVVALGATAGRALLGREVAVGRERGAATPFEEGTDLLLTVHPSYVLRLPSAELQAREYARLVADLRLALPYLAEAGAGAGVQGETSAAA